MFLNNAQSNSTGGKEYKVSFHLFIGVFIVTEQPEQPQFKADEGI